MGISRTVLLGRITQDLELKQTPNGVSVPSFTVEVDRNSKEKQTAEFIAKYFGKGRMIAVEGQFRTRTFDDKNGVKHYVTEVYVDGASFTGESKNAEPAHNNPAYIGNLDDYEGVMSDDGVPF